MRNHSQIFAAIEDKGKKTKILSILQSIEAKNVCNWKSVMHLAIFLDFIVKQNFCIFNPHVRSYFLALMDGYKKCSPLAYR